MCSSDLISEAQEGASEAMKGLAATSQEAIKRAEATSQENAERRINAAQNEADQEIHSKTVDVQQLQAAAQKAKEDEHVHLEQARQDAERGIKAARRHMDDMLHKASLDAKVKADVDIQNAHQKAYTYVQTQVQDTQFAKQKEVHDIKVWLDNNAATATKDAADAAADEVVAKGNQLQKHDEPSPSGEETMSSGETWSNSVSLSSSTAPSVVPSAAVFDRLNENDHPSDAFAAAAFMAASATEGIGAAARKAIADHSASATPSSA